MKKQVLGHDTRQAPANRSTGFYTVLFRNHTTRETCADMKTALAWYRNGATVSAVKEFHGFSFRRNSESATPSISETVLYTWTKCTRYSAKADELAHVRRVIQASHTERANVDRVSF